MEASDHHSNEFSSLHPRNFSSRESRNAGRYYSTDDTNTSTVSAESALSGIISQLIEVESAVLSQGNNQDILRQIAILKLQLLSLDVTNITVSPFPSSSSSLGRRQGTSTSLNGLRPKSPSLSARRSSRCASSRSLTPGTRRRKVRRSSLLDHAGRILEVPDLDAADDPPPVQVYIVHNSGDSSSGGVNERSSPRAGQKILSRESTQDHAILLRSPVARVDAGSIQSSRLTPVPVNDAFEYIEPATYQPDLNLKDWKGPGTWDIEQVVGMLCQLCNISRS
jgi:hypothetical protein